MDKEFMKYVYARIEKALGENAEYMKLQSDLVKAHECKDYNSYIEISDEMEAKTTEACYIQGYKDAMRLLLNLN